MILKGKGELCGNIRSVFGPAPVGQLLRQYAVPCVISLLVGALYNIVDQLFIANASYLGSFGNAANTVVFPLTVVALAVAVMIGDGCCAFVSISLGRGDIERARKSVGSAVALAIVSSLVLTALYLAFADPLVTLFGGRVNEETFGYAQEYLFYITLGLPFYMFGQAMNPVIRADGSPKFAMTATLAGAAVNIVLACVNKACFIFLQAMGRAGRPPRCLCCGRWCSVWALLCCCPGSSGWTACCTPCPCPTCWPSAWPPSSSGGPIAG